MQSERPVERLEGEKGGGGVGVGGREKVKLGPASTHPLDINKPRTSASIFAANEADSHMLSQSLPQGNISSRRSESPQPALPNQVFLSSSHAPPLTSYSFFQTPLRSQVKLTELKETSVTSVIKFSQYGNMQLRLQFKGPVISKLVSVRNTVNPYPVSNRASMKVPQPPDIKALGDYHIVKTLGSGSTAKVQMAVHASTKEHVAIKCIVRQRPGMDPPKNSKESVELREKRIFREASILYLVKHPNIVGLKDFFICDEYFCMIFEYIEGVQLLDYITANGKLKEKAARKFMRQMVSAVGTQLIMRFDSSYLID